MRDIDIPTLDSSRGERLSWHGYREDFWQRRSWTGGDAWKLERRQYFEESEPSPGRQALRQGDWDEAMRLIAADRDEYLRHARDDQQRGAVFHRVRVVEEPLTPYVQWELHALRDQAETGMPVRVLAVERVRSWESAGGLLPELISLGDHTLYELHYTPAGVPSGGTRFTDPEIVARWSRFIQSLFEAGEDLIAYFERYVAQLPPPKLTGRAE